MNFIWAFLIGFGSCFVLVFFIAIYKLNQQKAMVNKQFNQFKDAIDNTQKPINQDKEKESDKNE